LQSRWWVTLAECHLPRESPAVCHLQLDLERLEAARQAEEVGGAPGRRQGVPHNK
jgi:hypothetical protein